MIDAIRSDYSLKGNRSLSADPLKVPFDIAATHNLAQWRTSLAWPLELSLLQNALIASERSFLKFIGSLPDGRSKRAAILAAGRCVSSVSALIEAALLVQSEQGAHIQIFGGPPELDWLRGREGKPPSTPQRVGQPGNQKRGLFIRRAARTKSWTGWRRLPATLLRPEVIAVSHNSILREMAAISGRRVMFQHADHLLNRLVQSYDGPRQELPVLVDGVANALTESEYLSNEIRERLRPLIEPKLHQYLSVAWNDLQALEAAKELPHEIWSGSAGNYAARALGIEVMRRGGAAVRFDHGGSTGMSDVGDPLVLRETMASSRFVATSADVAALCTEILSRDPIPGLPQAAIANANGDPHMRCALTLQKKKAKSRANVIYATGALYGFRQLVPPVLKDPIYLDWQMRVAEYLVKQPINLLLKPHPEGIFRGQPHPISAIGPTTREPFEKVMDEADLFIFDFAASTAFWTALCSDRPVVYLDLGLMKFHPRVRALLERRVKIVTVHENDKNLPDIDWPTFGEAISDALRTYPDPRPFRALISGSGA
ncbi:MAG: hypothetical protein AB7M05_19480 [Alphaproteobacteria bacterium]